MWSWFLEQVLGADEVIRGGSTPMPKCQNNNIVIYVDRDSWSKFWVHKKQHGIVSFFRQFAHMLKKQNKIAIYNYIYGLAKCWNKSISHCHHNAFLGLQNEKNVNKWVGSIFWNRIQRAIFEICINDTLQFWRKTSIKMSVSYFINDLYELRFRCSACNISWIF